MALAELDPRPHYRITESEKRLTRALMNTQFKLPGGKEELEDALGEMHERAEKALAEDRFKTARSVLERVHEEDDRRDGVYPLLYSTLQSLFDQFENDTKRMGEDDDPIDFLVLQSIEDPDFKVNLKRARNIYADKDDYGYGFFLSYSFEDLEVGLYTSNQDEDVTRVSFAVDVAQNRQPIVRQAALMSDLCCAFIGVFDSINFTSVPLA